jgi:hypothetical protein
MEVLDSWYTGAMGLADGSRNRRQAICSRWVYRTHGVLGFELKASCLQRNKHCNIIIVRTPQ